MIDAPALVARARGLNARLLDQAQLEKLCASNAEQLDDALVAAGILDSRETRARTLHEIERLLRKRAADRLNTLTRWDSPNQRAMQPLLLDEDLRSVRAIVRATMAGARADDSLATLIPTRNLPERALRMLAAAPDVAAAAALLVAWRNPFGTPLAIEAARTRPELVRCEIALAQVFAKELRDAGQHDKMLQHYARRSIDLLNLWTITVLAEHATDLHQSTYLEGGQIITGADVALANSGAMLSEIFARLQHRCTGTPLRAVLNADANSNIEDIALAALAEEFRNLSLRAPTTLAPVIAFVLRQRLETRHLLRIVWSVALGVPATIIRESIARAA